MKYRDEDGNFQEVYFKATDTLPIGTEVDYDGEEVPFGWEEIDDPGQYVTRKIRKTEQVVGVVGQVLNESNNSQQNTYSCDFINKAFASISELLEGYNIDDLKESGFHLYRVYEATGSLPAGYTADNDFFVESYIISGDADFGRQVLLDINSNRMFLRSLSSDVWSAWSEVYTETKITSGTAEPSGGNNGDIYFKYS